MILSRHDSVSFCFKFVLIREIRVSPISSLHVISI